MKLKLSRKGDSESFETFRLLIAFVLATAVLVIIISMISSTNKQSILISEQKLKEGVQSAVKSAGTSAEFPFVIEDLMLRGTISKTTISNYSGLSKECIAFVGGSQMIPTDVNVDGLRIKPSYLKMNIWVYCNFQSNNQTLPLSLSSLSVDRQINQDSDVCPRYCVFFFNRKPEGLYNSGN